MTDLTLEEPPLEAAPAERVFGDWSFYDTNGELRVTGFMADSDAKLNAQVYGLSVLFGKGDPAKQYVQQDALVDRPALPLTLEGLILKGVPAGAEIGIEGKQYQADGSDVELSFSHAGTYEVSVTLFPYKAATLEVTYEAAP